MKKLRTVIAGAALLLATSAFATTGPEKVSPGVKAVFEKNFTAASNVKWEKTDDYYFASFTLNAKQTSVAYNENGELLGISSIIATFQLPVSVSLAISNKYEGFTVAKTATELTYQGETSYYVSVENNKQILRLKCTSSGDIDVERRTKK